MQQVMNCLLAREVQTLLSIGINRALPALQQLVCHFRNHFLVLSAIHCPLFNRLNSL